MTIKPITERDRQKGLKDIEKLWAAKPGRAARPGRRCGCVGGGLRTEALPHRATGSRRRDQISNGSARVKASDLAKILGGRNRASGVLNKKRNLSVEMKRALHQQLSITAESLLGCAGKVRLDPNYSLGRWASAGSAETQSNTHAPKFLSPIELIIDRLVK
jgi:hypothetical protein